MRPGARAMKRPPARPGVQSDRPRLLPAPGRWSCGDPGRRPDPFHGDLLDQHQGQGVRLTPILNVSFGEPGHQDMRATLVRIGIDQAYGGWNAPVDPETHEFVYVPIPEGAKVAQHSALATTYGSGAPPPPTMASARPGLPSPILQLPPAPT